MADPPYSRVTMSFIFINRFPRQLDILLKNLSTRILLRFLEIYCLFLFCLVDMDCEYSGDGEVKREDDKDEPMDK